MGPKRLNPRHRHASGQVLPMFVVGILVLVTAAALPIDGGLGLVMLRQTQTAADRAAEAGALALESWCGSESIPVAVSTLKAAIDSAVNSSLGGSANVDSWTANFVDPTGKSKLASTGASSPPALAVTFTKQGPSGGSAPKRACGVEVAVQTSRNNTLEGLVGIKTTQTSATGAALAQIRGGITALAEYGLHTLHAKGEGDFTVFGNVYDYSKGCKSGDSSHYTNPDASATNSSTLACNQNVPNQGTAQTGRVEYHQIGFVGWGEDTVDAFDFDATDPQNYSGQRNAIRIFGDIAAASKWPFDQCYYSGHVTGQVAGDARGGVIQATAPDLNTVYGPADNSAHPGLTKGAIECDASDPLAPVNAPRPPFVDMFFHTASGNGNPVQTTLLPPELTVDPLQSLPAPDTSRPDAYCPGAAAPYANWANANYSTGGDGAVHLKPGVYNYPVVIGQPSSAFDASLPGGTELPGSATGSVVLDDCSVTDPSGTHKYPGIYVFKQGVQICPGPGQSVTGKDVMLYADAPFGGSALPASSPIVGCPGMGKTTPFYGSPNVFENDDQIADAGYYGSGTYGITIGGRGSNSARSHVVLSAPESGPYKGVLLFQNRDATMANGGLNPGANIAIDAFPGKRDLSYTADNPAANPPQYRYQDTYHPYYKLASGQPGADKAAVYLNGIIYNGSLKPALASLTGGTQAQAKLACTFGDPRRTQVQLVPKPPAKTPKIPQCWFGTDRSTGQGLGTAQPTKYATIQPETLGGATCGDPAIVDPIDRAACRTQLTLDNMGKVMCSGGTPNSNAGRLQLGAPLCLNNNDAASDTCLSSKQPPPCQAQINLIGASVVDVFTTGGDVQARVAAVQQAEIVAISPP